MVELFVANEKVAGSKPVSRSILLRPWGIVVGIVWWASQNKFCIARHSKLKCILLRQAAFALEYGGLRKNRLEKPCIIFARPHRLAWSRTSDFRSDDRGSNPRGDAILLYPLIGESFLFIRHALTILLISSILIVGRKST